MIYPDLMPYDDASTDDEESDSTELADVDNLLPSEEEQQAAISQVTFDWCETWRIRSSNSVAFAESLLYLARSERQIFNLCGDLALRHRME